MVMSDMAYDSTVRGALILVHGLGVLVRGPSGSGKSLAALNLMRRGHLLVADDVVKIMQGPTGEPMGKALEANVRIEVRGLGIFDGETLFPGATAPLARIDLVVDLDAFDGARDTGRIAPETSSSSLLGHEIPTVRLPLPTGGDAALMIEIVSRLHKAQDG
jgi:HPr kinase/phosphorylase